MSAGSNPANLHNNTRFTHRLTHDDSLSVAGNSANSASLLALDNGNSKITRRVIDIDGVPQGFEGVDEPQETEVDIFYGGFYLVSVKSRFTSVDILMLDVDRLVDTLVDLKDSGKFRELLAAPFYANAKLASLLMAQNGPGSS